jgi:2-amino-4-hydroxy-6-hydroxymethyldihydropteridine diphosphokinase
MNRLILSLGGNLGDVPSLFEKAIPMLQILLKGENLQKSGLYRTEPLYDKDQPWFWNMAIAIETPYAPLECLTICQQTETALGRERGLRRYGPRLIDIDLIFFNELSMISAELTIPHPRFNERKFVLLPISEFAVNYLVPGIGQTVGALLQRCPDKSSVEKIE